MHADSRPRPIHAWLLAVLFAAALPALSRAQSTASSPAPGGGAVARPEAARFPKPRADLPYLAPDKAWPDRWGRAGATIKGVIIDIDDPKLRLQSTRRSIPSAADDTPDAVAMREANVSGLKPPEKFVLEGPGSFVFLPTRPKEGAPPVHAINEPSMRFRYVSGQLELNKHGAQVEESVRLERTWFSVFDAILDGEGARPRGAVLLMPGLFATPEGTLDKLTTALRKRGWVVLRMMAQPSRFTERVEFELNAGGDLEAQARRIGESFGNRVAECAFAAQGAFEHLENKRPDLRQLPRVAIGFSGGAMTLPTVVARDPDRYRAAILVGGGADFWLMNQRSNYRGMIDAVRDTWDGPPPTELDRARLDELYLQNAPLDSYHTAMALKGKPVLLIQGAADLAVPSPLGDLLWERLGKPERWLQEGQGHEVLFMLLPQQFEKMMDWLDNATTPAPAAP